MKNDLPFRFPAFSLVEVLVSVLLISSVGFFSLKLGTLSQGIKGRNMKLVSYRKTILEDIYFDIQNGHEDYQVQDAEYVLLKTRQYKNITARVYARRESDILSTYRIELSDDTGTEEILYSHLDDSDE